MNELTAELKTKIVETLYLEDITPEEIDENSPLVGGELGIDSIDILELVMMIEQDYGVVIDNKELGEKVFASVAALAAYVRENRPESTVPNNESRIS
ncbi:MAG: phosphopantetheine-binding protein [Desulfosalsimonadaceae bacterium]